MPIRVQITLHAQIRMYERNIAFEDVKRVLRRPNSLRKLSNNRLAARGSSSTGRLIEVICTLAGISPTTYVVVTVYEVFE